MGSRARSLVVVVALASACGPDEGDPASGTLCVGHEETILSAAELEAQHPEALDTLDALAGEHAVRLYADDDPDLPGSPPASSVDGLLTFTFEDGAVLNEYDNCEDDLRLVGNARLTAGKQDGGIATIFDVSVDVPPSPNGATWTRWGAGAYLYPVLGEVLTDLAPEPGPGAELSLALGINGIERPGDEPLCYGHAGYDRGGSALDVVAEFVCE
jgi:hypothetical protein